MIFHLIKNINSRDYYICYIIVKINFDSWTLLLISKWLLLTSYQALITTHVKLWEKQLYHLYHSNLHVYACYTLYKENS